MTDSENSRTLTKISIPNASPNEMFVENLSSVINRRNLLPLAARVLPSLLDDLPLRSVSGPTHVKELWPKWWDLHQKRLVAERQCRRLEARLLKLVGSRPSVTIEIESGSLTSSTFGEIRAVDRRVGVQAAAAASAELRRRRREWNAVDKRLGYSASATQVQDIACVEGIAGRVLISLQPYYIHEIAAKIHCMLVMHDPALKKEEMPWPYLRRMLRDLIQPQCTIVEPQSRLRKLRPIIRNEDCSPGVDAINGVELPKRLRQTRAIKERVA